MSNPIEGEAKFAKFREEADHHAAMMDLQRRQHEASIIGAPLPVPQPPLPASVEPTLGLEDQTSQTDLGALMSAENQAEIDATPPSPDDPSVLQWVDDDTDKTPSHRAKRTTHKHH